jgi:signal transduction histidine kinase
MRWHKSFYWRIALGFVLFLAAMLIVQAMLFAWVVARSGRTVPGESPVRFSQTVALDLSNALSGDPALDLARYLREQYSQGAHPFFVMLVDGRVITSGTSTFPETMLRAARERLQRRLDRPDGGPRGRGDGSPREGPPFGRGGGPPFLGRGRRGDGSEMEATRYLFARPTPIFVSGRLVGVVVVPPDAPFSLVLMRFAPMLGAVAVGVLLVGTLAASTLIFRPARRRLRRLEDAARRFGTGDLSARAPESGGDEIAAVATAFNAMADDLSKRAAALAASDQARRQLLADVSHELTTPVTAMRGYLETLTMAELALDEATRTRYLHIISDETARLDRIIGDLLDLARLEGGGSTLVMTEVSVAHLFDRVAARHERECERHRVTIARTIAAGTETVHGDRDRLEQVVQNLAGNALRYAPEGSTIHLRTERDGTGVTIAVEDAGPGIAPEHLPHIFDRFYKADASRAVGRADGQSQATTNGSGLGLSIVKAIVERHGGRLVVESRPGRTVVRFTIG